MKKYILLLLISFISGGIYQAQISLERQLIGTTGNISTQGSLSLSASSGEPLASFLSSGMLSLSQGFQQADGMSVGITAQFPPLEYQVFPNPTSGEIRIEIFSNQAPELGVEVFDIGGRSCGISAHPQRIDDRFVFELDLSQLSAASYVLIILQSGAPIHSIRVEKID